MAQKYVSEQNPMFRSQFAEDIFIQKYRHEPGCLTWADLAKTLVEEVRNGAGENTGHWIRQDEVVRLISYVRDLKFIPGGRYLYYAGRKRKYYNNCFLLKSLEDTREDWAELSKKAELCLSTGGGIGNDYSIYRAGGSILRGTGGIASGPLAKMLMIDGIGTQIMQGGSRRAAMYASLSMRHGDVDRFLKMKNWYDMPVAGTTETLGSLKEHNFNFKCPLDMTNISVNYDTEWLLNYWKTGEVGEVFKANVYQALSTGEPGFSFNFFDRERETLRNACTEVTSEKDSDACNLGSINLGRIDSIDEYMDIVNLATKFLVCGTTVADLPYDKVRLVREETRRVGLGLMGIHEWLIKRGQPYQVVPELARWLSLYRDVSRGTADRFSGKLGINKPIAVRAIAPTGSIAILAGSTSGIEPLYAVAYKRRYLKGTRWHHQYVVDSAAQGMIDEYGVDPEELDDAVSLQSLEGWRRRLAFQADVQDYVDQGISSTINLAAWGSETNNSDVVDSFTDALASNAHRLRGFTCYPDSSRGGQPLTAVPYAEAVTKLGEVFEEQIEAHDICDITGRGTCEI